jgi:hypothetical protein
MTGKRIIGTALSTVVALAILAGVSARSGSATPRATGLSVVAAVLSAAPHRRTYDWPVKPFDRQHPVRAFLDDPRIGDHGGKAFHFGIDIAAPDGTAVYAVEAGIVHFNSRVALCVVALDGSHSFGYWHIVPGVKNHKLVKRHQLIGWIGKGWGHLHFAERRDGIYVNPLRSGGLGPYADRTVPTVDAVRLTDDGLSAVAHDTPSPRVPGTWAGEPVTPALLRWRTVGQAGAGTWHTVADFRARMLPASAFDTVYTPETRQNHEGEPGRFSFYLAHAPAARTLLRTARAVEVEAADTAGNRVIVIASLGV